MFWTNIPAYDDTALEEVINDKKYMINHNHTLCVRNNKMKCYENPKVDDDDVHLDDEPVWNTEDDEEVSLTCSPAPEDSDSALSTLPWWQ